jgi:hypothetical protein
MADDIQARAREIAAGLTPWDREELLAHPESTICRADDGSLFVWDDEREGVPIHADLGRAVAAVLAKEAADRRTMADRVTHMRDVAEAARAAAETAAEHRKAWKDWRMFGSFQTATGAGGMNQGTRPTVPEPTDETEDVLMRLADALERRIHDIVEPRVPGTGGYDGIRVTTSFTGNSGDVQFHSGRGGSASSWDASAIHLWGGWHTAGQPWRECPRCGATQCQAMSEHAASNPEGGVWIYPEEPPTCEPKAGGGP